jgi:hypothetical protein
LAERLGSGDGERKTLLTRQIPFEPLPASVLGVPSMGAVLMGFKSPVYKPTHDENILMKIPAEVKVQRVIAGLKEDWARPASR